MLFENYNITHEEFWDIRDFIKDLAPEKTFHWEGGVRENSTGFWWPKEDKKSRYEWLDNRIGEL